MHHAHYTYLLHWTRFARTQSIVRPLHVYYYVPTLSRNLFDCLRQALCIEPWDDGTTWLKELLAAGGIDLMATEPVTGYSMCAQQRLLRSSPLSVVLVLRFPWL